MLALGCAVAVAVTAAPLRGYSELTKTVGGTTVETFQYDTLGRMTGAARDAGNQVTIAYDALGYVSSETQTVQNVPKTFTYTWHACGTLNTAVWADGNLDPNIGSFSYWHDALDNVTQIRRAGRPQVMYEWSGRRWKHRSVWLDPYQVQVLFTLAERNAPGRRITALNHSGRSDVFKEGFSYTRDALGDPNRIDRTGVLSAERSVDYLYDGLHRVTAASYDDGTNEAFALDTLGNRSGYLGRDANAVAYEHNTVNEYTSIAPGIAPQYSGTGNLTRDERGFKYAYDYENRLTEIKAPDDTLLAQYVYDPLGRRAAEIRYDQGPPLVMRYYFAVGPIGGSGPGQNLALEYKGLYGQVLERYTVHGATYIDEVAFFHDGPKNKDYACELNDTYSVVGLVGQDGRLLRAYEYDVYGRRREINTHWDFLIGLRNHLGATPTGDLAKYDVNDDGNIDLRDLTKARIPPELPGIQPWGFQGRIRLSYKTPGAIPQTLTVYDFRARFYEPTHGRFLQRDPMEYIDSYDLYEPLGGNPLVACDPSGAIWNHIYPKYLGGDPDGPTIDLSPEQHSTFHDSIHKQLRSHYKAFSGESANFCYGDNPRKVWMKLSAEQRLNVLVSAAADAGVNVGKPEYQNALQSAYKSADHGSLRRGNSSGAHVVVEMIPPSKARRLLPRALRIIESAGKALALIGFVAAGAEIMSTDPHNEYLRDMMQTTRKAKSGGDLLMIDEVFILHDLYQLTDNHWVAQYGWQKWYQEIGK